MILRFRVLVIGGMEQLLIGILIEIIISVIRVIKESDIIKNRWQRWKEGGSFFYWVVGKDCCYVKVKELSFEGLE